MASGQKEENWTEELICPICRDFFKDPVLLQCGHNTCNSCITGFWEKTEINSCPECREVFPERNLRVNRALGKLAAKARESVQIPKGKESILHCEEHQEELKLVCENDKKIICYTCKDSPEHRGHSIMQIDEAVEKYKKSSIESLTKKMSDYQEIEQKQKQKISKVREQANSLQTHITSEFDKMEQILTEKKQGLHRDLMEEEKRILKTIEINLREIQENVKPFEEKISKLQKQMEQKDKLTFLKEQFCRKRKLSDNPEQLSTEDITFPVGKFKCPLQYVIWREMGNNINPVPASLTMDPNTAHPQLILSEDRTSVRLGDKDQELPSSQERFNYWFCVLGSQGFTSGRHYWEVEVKNKTEWEIGVARKSAGRQGKIDSSPVNGYWTVWRRTGNIYYTIKSRSDDLKSVNMNPQKIGVFLDYEAGQVSFYNADDMSHINTFTQTFTEEIFPFFCPGMNTNGENSAPLLICGSKSC